MSVAPRAHTKNDAGNLALAKIDVSQAELYEHGAHWSLFERLRRVDPVHFCAESEFGPFWSITKFDDIVKVETNHAAFSSNRDIVIGDQLDFAPPMFKTLPAAVIDIAPPATMRQRRRRRK